MMKRFYIFFILISVGLFAFDLTDDIHHPEMLNKHNITCGTCHGSAINTDIIIEPGKLEEDKQGRISALIDVTFNDMPVNYVEFSLRSNVLNGKLNVLNQKHEVDEYGVVMGANLSDRNAKSGLPSSENIQLEYVLDEFSSKPVELTIQGVIPDYDGTAEGDIVFEQKISLVPDFTKEFYVHPTITSKEVNVVFLAYETDEVEIQAIDLLGKTAKNIKVEASSGYNEYSLNVSDLEEGHYLLNVSRNGEPLTSKFIVRK